MFSVIVTTYNRPKTLDKVLAALQLQSYQNFEIVIADDGSGIETKRVIEAWMKKTKIPIKHAWQEDKGFRASQSRNNAVRLSQGDYLVFLDGDCLPRKNFLFQHKCLSSPGYVVAGNRCLMSSWLTEQVILGKVDPLNWSIVDFIRYRLHGGINRLDAFLTLPANCGFRYRNGTRWQRLRSCNMGLSRQDYEKVNGFDSSFVGWGFEDSDFAVRLINSGIKIKLGSFATAVFHLYHKETPEVRNGPNWKRLQYVLKSGDIYPIQGLYSLETMSKCNL